MAKEFLIVDNVPSANKYLPVSLIIGEVVQVIEQEESKDLLESQFVMVYHQEGKKTSKFHKSYFKKYTPKNKLELVMLIKNKGKLA